jgi:Cof subfamily protein (haloacid dehalogenase superfamily)
MSMTLYVSDLDGTLLDPHAEINPKSADMINRLLEQGMAFTYATARSSSSAGRITRSLHLRLPIITYNGAMTNDPILGKVTSCAVWDEREMPLIRDCIREQAITPLVYAMIDGEEKCSWLTGKETAGIARYVSSRKGNRRMRPTDNIVQLLAGNIFYMAFIGTELETKPAEEPFRRFPGLHAYLQKDTYYPQDYWLEIFRHDVSKASAVTTLKESLGAERLICFGDNLNDIPLFKAADQCYAVQNAHSELKRIATAVIGANDEDGVAEWLSRHYR